MASKEDEFAGLFKEEEASALSDQFNQATIYVRKKTSEINKDDLLYLYGRFKYANEGECNTERPGGIFNLEAKSKWDKWKSVNKNDPLMSKEKAKEEYISKLNTLFPNWNESAKKTSKADESGTFGIKTSIMVKELIDDSDKNCFDSCKEGSVERLKEYLAKNPKLINQTDENGMTMAMWACDRGHLEILKLLSDKGADLNKQDSDGQTALHYSCSNDQVKLVEFLVKNKKVNTKLTDNDGLKATEMTDNKEIIQLINSNK